ncbi:polyphosphate polymerase domain-containing protein [Anaerotignum sp.]|uniref:polyphosphate polymerase domain-containing protein n=1 Tax=Anaerotignum sp. TaxID=2039241 RepID=UPI0028AE0DC7|nr:polyphosphate polymerase domain-containing protein [Anaerotignum sp.]
MSTPTTFERKEVKYFITYQQRAKLANLMELYMSPDSFGKSTIMNIYYDTDDKQFIRHSMEKPVYKEKLRVRSYGTATPDSTVFVELKKKYKGVVYKRRVSMSQSDAKLWLEKNTLPLKDSQIIREIDYFTHYNAIKPSVLLSYQREAFFGKENSDFRMTFDESILWRDYDVCLCKGAYGSKLLPKGTQLLEVKAALGIPLWLTKFFSENNIFRTSYSKYGNAYVAMTQRESERGNKFSA